MMGIGSIFQWTKKDVYKRQVFIKEKVIYVDNKLKSKITKNTNSGMQYC